MVVLLFICTGYINWVSSLCATGDGVDIYQTFHHVWTTKCANILLIGDHNNLSLKYLRIKLNVG